VLQRKVQKQHMDPRLTKQAEAAASDVVSHQRLDLRSVRERPVAPEGRHWTD
jgi:hypothetical protein